MKKGIRVLPSTIRVENIDLLDFLKDLSEILKHVPELEGIRAHAVTLVSSRGNISMSFVAKDAFNVSGPGPEILDKLVEAMKKHYEVKTT